MLDSTVNGGRGSRRLPEIRDRRGKRGNGFRGEGRDPYVLVVELRDFGDVMIALDSHPYREEEVAELFEAHENDAGLRSRDGSVGDGILRDIEES